MNSGDDLQSENLPPPPPLPSPSLTVVAQRISMNRPGFGSRGLKQTFLTNHFEVKVSRTDGYFFQYSVSIKYEDGTPVDAKGIGRKILEKMKEMYAAELSGKDFAYDGENTLFTLGALPQSKMDFNVVLEDRPSNRKGVPEANASPNDGDRKRSRRNSHMKSYLVAINYATKIPLVAIAKAIRGEDSEQFQEAVRVLDIILRQNAYKQGCLLVKQSFFHNEPRNFVNLGSGVLACRGIHSSFRATQGALSLNMDVSTTIIVQPGPVVEFLLANQGVNHPSRVDWAKAKRTLKNLRIKAVNTNLEHKIRGLSDKACGEQIFSLKVKGGVDEVEVSVYDYFVRDRKVPLKYSKELPCIDVGKPKRPVYVPIELCELVSLQRYTRAMSNLQRAALVEKSRQKPQERMNVLRQALDSNNYTADPLFGSCGVAINREFTKVEGRVLQAPKLIVGNGREIFPRNGRWNFNSNQLFEPIKLDGWAIVSFNPRCNMRKLSYDLVRCAQMKGMTIPQPENVFEENPSMMRAPPQARVDAMLRTVRDGLSRAPQFMLCILPDRKNSELYGPWKRKTLCQIGIPTQCAVPPPNVKDQYLTNLLLKINAKLGGLNSKLTLEHSRAIPLVSKVPTLIIGMDVSHCSPGRDIPSVAAVVSSREWPLITRYRAAVQTQPAKMEMVDSMFKLVGGVDEGLFSELLSDFYRSSGSVKPDHIVIFRDGVSESQFSQVLNIELEQIIQACKFKDAQWRPKFTLIVAQKNHHTKFFQTNSPDNVPPGTVIDKGVCHPKNNDFYMCAQAGMIGTTRPTHYHVLYDEIGFAPDDLQELVHSLSYVYQRSTTAISVVAPICYAHLAAAQVSQFIKFDDMSDGASSSHGGDQARGGAAPVPELPVLNEKVKSSMFFC